MFSPTTAIFSFCVRAILNRLTVVHGEGEFCQYLERQYFRVDGDGRLTATWWCGFLSHFRAGVPPSQQVAEQQNSKLKRDLSVLPRGTHQDVCLSLERLMEGWAAPLKPGEELRDTKTYSLSAPLECLSTDRPRVADSCMVVRESFKVCLPGGIKVSYPSIPLILRKMRTLDAAGNSKYFQEIHVEDKTFWFMATRRPQLVSSARATKLRRYLRTTAPEALALLLEEDGVVEKVDEEGAPHRLKLKAYGEIFGDWCVQVRRPEDAFVRCSCPLWCWTALCPHAAAVEEYTGLKAHVPVSLPRAEGVREAPEREPSDSERPADNRQVRRRLQR